MYREMGLKNALEAYINGEDVRVILPAEDFEDRLVPIERLFNDARFLVDKKVAKPNPEWEAAMQDMVSQNPPTPEPVAKAKRKSLDMGKVQALRNAGWSMKKIADEMGVSEGTIWNNLKKLEGGEIGGSKENVPEL